MSLGTTYVIPPTLMVDHDTLYVEVGVADEANSPGSSWALMTPRSQIQTSAYAQRSRRVLTQESDDDYLVRVENTGQGGGIYAATDSTTDSAKAGAFLASGTTGRTYGVYAENDSSDGVGVYGTAPLTGVAEMAGITKRPTPRSSLPRARRVSTSLERSRDAFTEMGLSEYDLLTVIEDESFSMVLTGWPSAEELVIQGVVFGESTNVNIRLEEVVAS